MGGEAGGGEEDGFVGCEVEVAEEGVEGGLEEFFEGLGGGNIYEFVVGLRFGWTVDEPYHDRPVFLFPASLGLSSRPSVSARFCALLRQPNALDPLA